MASETDRLCFTLERELGGTDDGPPEEVQFLPSGEVRPKGKTGFIVDEHSVREIMEAFGAGSTDLVVDYEHQSLSGSEAPAAGWVRELVDRGEGGLWAKVEWTARAVEYLKNREYRYISPVVLIRKFDGRAVELLGAALTNLPAIDGMEPVVNSALCHACGSPMENSGETAVMYGRVMGLLGLNADATVEAAGAAIESLKRPDGFVPEQEHEALKARLCEMESGTLIAQALSDGRLAPAQRRWAESYAASDMEGFREFLGSACRVVPLSDGFVPAGHGLEPGQAKMNALLGITNETFARYSGREIQGR